MDFARELMSELRDTEAFEQWRSHRRSVGLSSLELRSLAFLRGELINCAPTLSLTASIANQLATGGRSGAQFTLDALETDMALSGTTALQAIEPAEDCFEVVQHWRNVNCRLAFAKTLTRQARLTSAGVDMQGRIDVMADGWQRTCGAAFDCVRKLESVMISAGMVGARGDEATMMDMLLRSSQGLSPCLDDDGQPRISGWAERRLEARLRLDVEIEIRILNVMARATLLDLSSMGASVQTAGAVGTGQEIFVKLRGNDYPATVVWKNEHRVGLKFGSRLPSDLLDHYRPRCNR